MHADSQKSSIRWADPSRSRYLVCVFMENDHDDRFWPWRVDSLASLSGITWRRLVLHRSSLPSQHLLRVNRVVCHRLSSHPPSCFLLSHHHRFLLFFRCFHFLIFNRFWSKHAIWSYSHFIFRLVLRHFCFNSPAFSCSHLHFARLFA